MQSLTKNHNRTKKRARQIAPTLHANKTFISSLGITMWAPILNVRFYAWGTIINYVSLVGKLNEVAKSDEFNCNGLSSSIMRFGNTSWSSSYGVIYIFASVAVIFVVKLYTQMSVSEISGTKNTCYVVFREMSWPPQTSELKQYEYFSKKGASSSAQSSPQPKSL